MPAGLPEGWKSGNKTGTGDNGATNNVAIVWQPGGAKPILIAVYFTESKIALDLRENAIAEVAGVVSAAFMPVK